MNILEIVINFFLSPWFLLSAAFWIVVLILVYLLRNKKDAAYLFFPLLALFKTKKLNNFINKLGRKAPKFWKYFWTIGIFVSFSFTIYGFYFFIVNFYSLIVNPQIENAIIPLIPGVTIDLPLYAYLIVPLLFIITTHELAHGISAVAENVDIKSTGVLGAGLFFIIGFGAFVEVDERKLNSVKYHRNTRLRIAAAGTYVNAITVGIAFLLILSFPTMMAPFYYQVPQIGIVLTEEEGGFNYGKISNEDVIVAIKKEGEENDKYLYLDDFGGITIDKVLYNQTENFRCSIGDNLMLKIYDPVENVEKEKTITLGPRYNIGIQYYYPSNYTLRIVEIISEEEGGNNYDKDLTQNLNITKINGTPINLTNGNRLEKYLTQRDLKQLTLTSESNKRYYLDAEVDGVLIGIRTYIVLYWMYKNDLGKNLTNNFPVILITEFIWLFVIAFSITLFNMMPLPIFDGDRIVKELINWGIGEDFKTKKKKKDRFLFEKDKRSYDLTEYRVEKVNSVKIILKEESQTNENSEILLGENNYELIDNIQDGFKDTISFNLPEKAKISDNSVIEVFYDYISDDRMKKKKLLLNTIRIITLFIIIGNFLLSFLRFGFSIFWV